MLLDVRLFVGGVDLSGSANRAELTSVEREPVDVTNYRSGGWNEHLGGLGSAQIEGEGFWEAGPSTPVDDTLWSGAGGRGPWTICPSEATVGALAYVMDGLQGNYNFGGTVGEAAPWTATGMSSSPLGRGQIAHPPGTARTATGTGTALNLGAVPAGKKLVATLHVLSVAGTAPSITARVESDDASGFATPTTQATFTAATAAGGQVLTVNGPVADTWWRVAWTISGTSPSFLFVSGLGIS